MQCMSCNENIPPSWISCIQRNSCPACGKEIMNEKSKEMLDELREAMQRMPSDPEGLAGWLLSNYKLVKIGDGEPVNFYGRRPRSSSSQRPVQQGQAAQSGQSNDWFKRAGVEDPAQKPSLKALVNQIHNSIEAEEEELARDDYDYPEDYEDYEYEVQEYQPAPSIAKHLVNNSVMLEGGGEPPSPEERAAILAALGGDSSEVLENERKKRSELSRNVDLGVGLVKRSG